MSCKFTDLHCKEVICITDGRRLGFVSDARVELPEGKICAIIVPCPGRFGGLVGRREDYVIPWHCIRNIGDDIILIEGDLSKFRLPRGKKDLF